MLEIIYRKGPARINHVWFYDDNCHVKSLKHSSIYFLHGVATIPVNCNVIHSSPKHTLINDLSLPQNEIWSKLSSSHRNEIRRCIRDNTVVQFYTSEEIQKIPPIIECFSKTYNNMFQDKGLKTTFNLNLFRKYAQCNALFVSVAMLNNEPAVYHSYIVDDIHSRFWYSCSDYRNDRERAAQIGRLNRFLHWSDFLKLAEMGVIEYDWGGVNFENPETKGISEFKKGFGGDEKELYDVVIASNGVTGTLGKLAMEILYGCNKL